MTKMATDILVRDTNGNTLYKAEMGDVPYDGFAVTGARITDAGTLVVTVELEDDDRPDLDEVDQEWRNEQQERYDEMYPALEDPMMLER